ncbi:MAG TPA: FlgD immunoglobulin-like domain containing protein, partial [Candidatus Syntrophosphaera sp.]|nr:FlgD immunoglobulin-like domain containing protein [Candidatus Syntrophosphaera sp.]
PVANSDPLAPELASSLSCRPNPFFGQTLVTFTLGRGGDPVTLNIYNLRGQKVRAWDLGPLDKGEQQALWDGRDDRGQQVAAGIYILELRTSNWRRSLKILRLPRE